ncbi:MAG: 50S ribosomal protein L10 [Thermoleophilia bacterium]|nr:50S ribosomal protein L10 [Thermoleophilia bacterium]
MPKPEKVAAVKEIAQDLSSTDVYYFVDYRGLTFKETAQLRARLQEAGATLKVVKNTLARIAAAEANVEGLERFLQGPTAIAYCYGDPARVAKVLQDFAREKKKTSVRGARLQHLLLDQTGVERIATLPSREQLVGQVVGLIAAPLRGLVTVLGGPMRGLAVVLDQIREQKAQAA